jgi:hypothetical protein
MTAFFTRYFKKTNLTVIFLFSLFLMPVASASDSRLSIVHAELVAQDDQYLLNADLELNLSEQVHDALSKGVPLNFLVEFQLTTPRKYWFDREIITVSNDVSLSYHALSRQYLLKRNRRQESYATLGEAIAEFSRLREWVMFDRKLLEPDLTYFAGLRVRLDHSKLPKPIQVEAMGSEAWNMISQRHRWEPALIPPSSP